MTESTPKRVPLTWFDWNVLVTLSTMPEGASATALQVKVSEVMGRKASFRNIERALRMLTSKNYLTAEKPGDGPADTQNYLIYQIYVIGERALKMRPPQAPRTLEHQLLICAGHIGAVVGFIGMRLFAGTIAELCFTAVLYAGLLYNVLLLLRGHSSME